MGEHGPVCLKKVCICVEMHSRFPFSLLCGMDDTFALENKGFFCALCFAFSCNFSLICLHYCGIFFNIWDVFIFFFFNIFIFVGSPLLLRGVGEG